jgi:putative flippase GtrA
VRGLRYASVSVVSMGTTQLLLMWLVASGLQPARANITAVIAGAVPAYVLYRYWAWSDAPRDDVVRQTTSYLVVVVIGLGLSTLAVHLAAQVTTSPPLLGAANISAFGLIFVARFFVLDRFIFVRATHRPAPAEHR